jgi:hypothetical protein
LLAESPAGEFSGEVVFISVASSELQLPAVFTIIVIPDLEICAWSRVFRQEALGWSRPYWAEVFTVGFTIKSVRAASTSRVFESVASFVTLAVEPFGGWEDI